MSEAASAALPRSAGITPQDESIEARFLYETGRLACLGLTLFGLLGALSLWGRLEPMLVTGWLLVLLLVVAGRLLDLRRFGALLGERRSLQALQRTLLPWSVVQGLLVGVSAAEVFAGNPGNSPLTLGAAGYAALGILWCGPGRVIYALFAGLAMLPFAAGWWLLGEALHAGVLLLYYVLLLVAQWRGQATLAQALRLGREHLGMLEVLRSAKDRAERLNRDLAHEIATREQAEARLKLEHDFLAGVLDTEGALVMVLDTQGRIVRFNRACETATGYVERDIKLQTVWETLIHPDDRAQFRRDFAAVLDGTFPLISEIRLLDRTQQEHVITWSHTGILAAGHVTHVVATGIDETDRRSTEQALQRSRQDFGLLVEGVKNYAIYMLDPEGRVINWNAGAERITGYRQDEIVGQHFSRFYPQEENHSGQAYFHLQLAATEGRYEYEGWHLRKDGSPFWAAMAITALTNEQGRVRAYSVITGDFTARKRSEDTIRTLLRVSREINATLDIDELLVALVRESIRLLGAESGMAGLLHLGQIRVQQYFTAQGETSRAVDYRFKRGQGLAGYVMEYREPYLTNAARSDPRIPVEFKRELDIRSALCCPITDFRGEVLGCIEIHNKRDAEGFTSNDSERLTGVARSAALAIQNALAYRRLQEAERLLTEEAQMLELVAKGAALREVLDRLAQSLEEQTRDLRCAVLVLDDAAEAVQFLAAPTLDAECRERLQQISAKSLQLAHNSPTLRQDGLTVYDISAEALWRTQCAHEAGPALRPTWLCPVQSQERDLLGAILTFSDRPETPDPDHIRLLVRATHIAGIAIERERTQQGLFLRDRAIESSLNGVVIVEPRLSGQEYAYPIVYANPAYLELAGHWGEGVINRDWLGLHRTQTNETELDRLASAMAAGHDGHAVLALRDADGQPRWAEVLVSPVHMGDDGGPLQFLAIMSDISDRLAAERALRESEEKYKAITANVPGMVFQLRRRRDGQLQFHYVSSGARQILGIEPARLLEDATLFTDHIQEEDRDELYRSMAISAGNLSTWEWQGRLNPTDQASRWISISSSPRPGEEDAVIWDGILSDITGQKHAQLQLQTSREELRALSAHLQTVREDEKAYLAREIHDELGSTMTALKLDIAWLRRHLPAQGAEDLRAKSDQLIELVDAAVAATRRISTDLRPPILDDMGLIPTLEWQTREFEKRTGIPVELAASGDSGILDDAQTVALFRITQEALTNIARHAEASHVWILVKIHRERVIMEVRDDGKGLQRDWREKRTSHGVHGMFERVRGLGGDIQLDSAPGAGTHLQVRIPLHPAPAQHSAQA